MYVQKVEFDWSFCYWYVEFEIDNNKGFNVVEYRVIEIKSN